jgi:Phage integrase family
MIMPSLALSRGIVSWPVLAGLPDWFLGLMIRWFAATVLRVHKPCGEETAMDTTVTGIGSVVVEELRAACYMESTDTVAAVLTSAAATARRTCSSVPENIHCHMLRKTKAMDLYQQRIPLPIIMRLLGHENVSTTAAFYAFATLDMMRAAVNAATPAINSPSERLTEDKLQALYSLR